MWILLIIGIAASGWEGFNIVKNIEFNTQTACEEAAVKIKDIDNGRKKIFAFCVYDKDSQRNILEHPKNK